MWVFHGEYATCNCLLCKILTPTWNIHGCGDGSIPYSTFYIAYWLFFHDHTILVLVFVHTLGHNPDYCYHRVNIGPQAFLVMCMSSCRNKWPSLLLGRQTYHNTPCLGMGIWKSVIHVSWHISPNKCARHGGRILTINLVWLQWKLVNNITLSTENMI